MKQHRLVVVFAVLLAAPGLTSLRAADVTWDGSGDMTWTQPDATSWSGDTYASGDTARFTGSGQGTGTLSGTITPGAVIVSAGAYTFAGTAIGGVGGLTVSGGTATVNNAANTYSGDTIIDVGAELYLYESNRLPYGAGKGDVTVNGLLRLRSGRTYTLNGLNGSGSVFLPGAGTWDVGTLVIGSNDASSVFSGSMSNSASVLHVTKKGSGTIELSGESIYRGNTIIENGVLILSGANTLSATITVSNGATLKFSHAQAINGATQLILAGGATLDVADIAYTLGNSQQLKLNGNGDSATLATAAGTGLALGPTSPIHFSAYDGATPPLTVSGAGSLTLAVGNTVTVTVAGTNSLAVGDYTLISGGVAGDAPTTYVQVNGAGRAAATTAELLISGGDLVLSIAAYSPVHPPSSIATAAAGPWDSPGTWTGGIVPGPGDSVTVNHAVSLWCGTHELASFVNNTTLTCNGWNAPLKAGEVTINGTMTHPAQSATAPDPVTTNWIPDNRVWIVCTNLTLNEDKAIDTYKKGYGVALGPGGIASYYGGAHGGYGQGNTETYGSAEAPIEPGSGGGGAAGGGVVRITATGTITVYGTVTANGGLATIVLGHGSGGSIFLHCQTLAGDGLVSANGGSSANQYQGDGGGGRIAVIYDSSAQSNEPLPTITFDANGGGRSDMGTLYFSDNQFMASPMRHSGQWMVPGTTNWSCDDLVFTNASLRFPEEGFILNITNDLVLTGAGDSRKYGLQVSDARLSCGGSLKMEGCTLSLTSSSAVVQSINVGGDCTMTNVGTIGSMMYLYPAVTNGAAPDYGALVDVTGTFYVSSNSIIYPYSQGTNGGSVFFSVGSLTLASNSLINADFRGYYGTYGPGASGGQDGASYGGRGGGASSKPPYGNEEWPTDPGSGGASGRTGGGLVWIEARKNMTIDGTIRATGTEGGTWTSGASGGGVALKCRTLFGTGTITANGCAYWAHEWVRGGGGRIAIWRMFDKSSGLSNNVAAVGVDPAENGTVFWGWLPIPGLRVIFR